MKNNHNNENKMNLKWGQWIVPAALLLFNSGVISAAPVMNENVANSSIITIYPDHADPNQYYVAPNVVMIARNESNVPYFSYYEYKKDMTTTYGLMQMTLVPYFTRGEMDAAVQGIVKKNPKAQFTGLPFVSAELILNTDLKDIFAENHCSHTAGLIAQEQSCQLVLTKRGRKMFYHALETRNLFTTLQFEYSVEGMIRLAEGGFKNILIQHGVAARIDGDQLADYPQLIRRK